MSEGLIALGAYLLWRAMILPVLAYHAIKQRAWTLPR